MTLGFSMLKESSSCILKCKHMTLANSMLNNIFSLLAKVKNYHVRYPKVICEMS